MADVGGIAVIRTEILECLNCLQTGTAHQYSNIPAGMKFSMASHASLTRKFLVQLFSKSCVLHTKPSFDLAIMLYETSTQFSKHFPARHRRAGFVAILTPRFACGCVTR
jgi:hypothetical protein